MNIVFWNIGKALTDKKIEWLERLVVYTRPDVCCIAEGPESIVDTQALIDRIGQNGYKCYYSPLLCQEPVISQQYGWNRCGLKIFIKKQVKLRTRFAFSNQKEDGRIIYLLFEKDGKEYSTFLIHATSMSSKTSIRQNGFIVELSNFVRAKTFNKNGGVIIMGDFNIEPWADSLKDSKYIESYFSVKSFDYFSSKHPQKRIYNNPILHSIEAHPNPDLIGTFYKGAYISVLDFPLLSRDINNYEVEILAEINGEPILMRSRKKNVLADELDHLPISLKIR